MSRLLLPLLLLFVAYEASPAAARRIYFGLDQDDHAFLTDSHGKPLTFRHRRFVFPSSGPAPPSPRSPSRIFFPDSLPPSAADSDSTAPPRKADNRAPDSSPSTGVTTVGNVWFPGETRDVTALGKTSSCGVGADLKYEYEGRTWKLLSSDNCPEGQWAVMVAECQPGCKPIPCGPGQLEHRGRCVNLTDASVCGSGQVLYIDQTGSTFCDCENDHFYYPWDGLCYARQEQGPCDFGYFLDLNENGAVECMPNDCQVDEYAKDPDTGRCFKKDFVGYCPKDRLQFLDNQTLDCFLIDIRNIFDRAITRSCPAGSSRSHLQDCRSEFVVPSVTVLPRSLTSGCYAGTINVRGQCRRVNNYLL